MVGVRVRVTVQAEDRLRDRFLNLVAHAVRVFVGDQHDNIFRLQAEIRSNVLNRLARLVFIQFLNPERGLDCLFFAHNFVPLSSDPLSSLAIG